MGGIGGGNVGVGGAGGNNAAGSGANNTTDTTNTTQNAHGTLTHLWLGRHIIAFAFLVILATLGIAVIKWDDPGDVVAVVGVVTSVVGTLVGTFFGLQVNAQERAIESQRRDVLTQEAITMAALANPTDAAVELRRLRGDSTANGNPTTEDI